MLPIHEDLAAAGGVDAHENLGEGTFTSTVFTNEDMYFPRVNINAHIIQGFHPGEVLADAFHLNNWALRHFLTSSKPRGGIGAEAPIHSPWLGLQTTSTKPGVP